MARPSPHPAGHVLGSAQVRIEVDGEVWVLLGDYRRQPDPTCAPFEVVPCDVFVTETTLGLPVYRWPDTAAVARDILAWRDECAAEAVAAVLFCCALGKAQRLLAELGRLDDTPAWLHGAIAAGVEVYREAGIHDAAHAHDRCGRAQTGFASGWMQRAATAADATSTVAS